MKKMNNKGFAITTIIYGLSIMGVLIVAILLATMATNRNNSKQLAKSIEEELNRYSKTEITFAPRVVGTVPIAQEYRVATGQSGWYKIELWGSQGGNGGGRGAYTSGIIELEEGDILYFYVGNYGSSTAAGRSTDVRVINGDYDAYNSYRTRIMVAAGGGTDAGASGGTLSWYNGSMNGTGGKINSSDSSSDFNLQSGTLTGLGSYTKPTAAETGTASVRSPVGENNGGDGYFAGNASTVGGTSFIAGYAGCRAYSHNASHQPTISDQPIYQHYDYVYDEITNQFVYGTTPKRSYYFVDGMMLAGVNTGAGAAKIERIAVKTDDTDKLARKNEKLNNVRTIKDCADGSTGATIIAIEKGEKVAGTSTTSGTCTTLTLNRLVEELDEIAVWHQDGRDYRNHTIQVSATSPGSDWIDIKGLGSGTALSETETVNGIHISAYQPDSTTYLPKTGNYYLLPVLSENKVVTSYKESENDANPIKIEYLKGLKTQIWNIVLLEDTKINPDFDISSPATYEYKVVELARFKALTLYQDENIIKNKIIASTSFNSIARDKTQIWKIIPVGNGTYQIETVVPAFYPAHESGNILPQTNINNEDDVDVMMIGAKNRTTARFKIISANYSGN